MKKIFSIFLIAFATLTANTFNAGAQNFSLEPGKVKFKFNVKNVESPSDPVEGVQIRVNMRAYSFSANQLILTVMATSTASDASGVAYATASFSPNAEQGGYFGGYYLWAPGSGGAGYVPQQIIDLDPITSGYSYQLPPPLSGLIRNLKDGYRNMTKVTVNHATYGPYDNCYLDYSWLTQGALAEFDVYVTDPNPSTERTLTFDTTTISNADQFTSVTVEKGTTVDAPSATPIHKDHPDWDFLYWTADGVNEFTFPVSLTSNVTLRPKWHNPNRQGLIHFQVYLWDHDGYREPTKLSTNYSYDYVGVNGSQVPSNYASYELTGKGWTTIPVSGLRFKLRTYPHQSGAPTNPGPVGAPVTPGWENDIDISTVTTDEDGCATMIIPSEDMQYLTANYCIDCDPDPNCVGTIIRDADYGREPCVFDWDWMSLGAGQGAGLVGVRYIMEGPRHQDTGIQIGSWNDNDALLLTQDNIDNGFECTFVCYVLSAPCAQFDVNGGTMPTSTNPALYPIQKYKPLNSAGVHVDPWIVQNPGFPIPNNPAEETFAGWFEVRYDMSGHSFESTVPFDFSKEIQKSVNLIAKYKGIVPMYTVRWAPDGWTGASDSDLYEIGTTYELGQTPTFNQELPTRDGADITGWDIYVKMKDGSGDKTFGSLGKYKYIKTVTQAQPDDYVFDPDDLNCMRYVVYQGETFWCSPLAVGSPDGNGTDQIYVARFRTMLTVTKSGLKLGDSALITVTNGVDTRKIVLTGNSSGTDVSKTLYVDAGTWTVTEDMAWSWAYENSTSSKQVTITAGEHATISFTNSVKTTVPQHGEHLVNNVFNE